MALSASISNHKKSATYLKSPLGFCFPSNYTSFSARDLRQLTSGVISVCMKERPHIAQISFLIYTCIYFCFGVSEVTVQWRIQGGFGGFSPPSNKSSTYLNIRHTTIRFSKTLNQMNRFDLCDDSKTKYKWIPLYLINLAAGHFCIIGSEYFLLSVIWNLSSNKQ